MCQLIYIFALLNLLIFCYYWTLSFLRYEDDVVSKLVIPNQNVLVIVRQ